MRLFFLLASLIATAAAASPSCGIRCSNEDAPVCGSDGQIYRNRCHLEAAKCEHPSLTLASPGTCVELPFSLRPVPLTHALCSHIQCTKVYAPLCGSDGRTYANACEFAKALCEDPTLRVIKDGACPTPPPTPECRPKPCAAIYAPVCGSDGETYGNPCVFSFMQCLRPSLSIVHKGECGGHDGACLTIYAPVCGSDGNTYNNPCVLAKASAVNLALHIVHDGECTPSTDDCAHQDNCLDVFDPVCGTDGRTYPSACVLERVRCSTGTELAVASIGECPPRTDECLPPPCAPIYAPVCASNGETFGNPCVFSYAQCLDPSLQIIHEGECGSNPVGEPCPLIYAPLCGSDGQTYANDCMLRHAQRHDPALHVAHEGECGGGPVSEPEPCPLIYAPLCGSDGQTYANDCMLRNAQRHDAALHVAHEGECQPCPPFECPQVEAPVCGSDGETYGNACLLEHAQCRNASLSLVAEALEAVVE
ncbi:hypothetical protein P43SY_006942 [Pythium insidiosum]|uniref:Kazal-like domain-containing protein n=1 Tax=Pythium insidiosum TaxID=114742 RepID=A0AAD5QD06_PYTIN|nr:hypothetical protein P43SY_006942 [Pythium insidiosum]